MTKESVSPSASALSALMSLRGIGRRHALKIFGEAKADTNEGDFEELLSDQAPKYRYSKSDFKEAWSKAIEQLLLSSEAGINAFSYFDVEYPPRLRDTPDPPAVLFTKGNSAALKSQSCIAVIGTREPTDFGIEVAIRSGRTAAQAGFTVVSGLAHGCDTYGHQGCVEAQGIGVAVLAHGLDKIYPAANRDLADQLLELGGCWVSEYPIKSNPGRSAFAERDRIQSGLSDGVLVIETDVKGGTMHTVNFSRQQHRPLGCIAHPPRWLSEDKTKGNQKLIADGWAFPIADGDQLTQFMLQISHHSLKPTNVLRTPESTDRDAKESTMALKQISMPF